MDADIITDLKNIIELSHETIDKKLVWRLRIFFAIVVFLLGLIIYDIYLGTIHTLLATGGIILGFGIGIILGRMFKIRWHEENARVVAQLDTIGLIMSALYMCFALSRHWIFAHWVHGKALPPFLFCTVAGIMAGRIFSMRRSIRKVLREQNIIE